jgi:glycerophosphoryl diester phosphodiesterase
MQGALSKGHPVSIYKKMKKKLKFANLFFILLFLSGIISACSPEDDLTLENGNELMDEKKVQIIAHRGARSLAPENTMSAAIKAFECDADGWELDVAMSLDGEVVLIHDDTLERTSNVEDLFPNRQPWSVYDFTYEDLKKLDFGTWFIHEDPLKQIASGNVTEADIEKYRGEQMLTLREALLFTKDNNWWVNIEIKDASGTPADAKIVSEVVALVEALKMEDSVLISSFNFDYLRQVKSLNNKLATGVLVNKIVQDPIALMEELGAQAFHPGLKVTYEKQVQLLREAGYDVNVWTVNEESDLRKLMAMGVTGVFTDFPQSFVSVGEP